MTVLACWMKQNRVRDEDLASKTGFSAKTIASARAGEHKHLSTLTAISRETGIPLEKLQEPAPEEDPKGSEAAG